MNDSKAYREEFVKSKNNVLWEENVLIIIISMNYWALSDLFWDETTYFRPSSHLKDYYYLLTNHEATFVQL